jgi:hypothetical protein
MAAVIFAITGYLTAQAVRPLLPEGQPTNLLNLFCILIPVVCGWRALGRLVGKSYLISLNSGIYGIAVSIFFTVFAFSGAEMIKRSTRKQYDGPMDAIVNMFGIMVEYAALLLHPSCLIILATGAVAGGVLSEWAHRKFG